jgi:kynurenine 3-monooxygenase
LTGMSGERVNVIGAGLAGSLLAILLAKRGFRVTVFEKRADPRVGKVDSGRSINLALAARGIRGLQAAGVIERVMPLTIPMRGRMVHEHDGKTELQMYGVRPEEVIYSVSRAALNRVLIEAADEFENVILRFGCQAVNFDDEGARIEMLESAGGRSFTPAATPTIATDGGGSAIRAAMVARGLTRAREELLEHDYKELTIPAVNGRHVMDPNALHIWPRGGFMLIALPNVDGSFTATLFLARRGPDSFERLRTARDVEAFFEREFPSAMTLMPALPAEFFENPQGLLGTIYCDNWHARTRGSDILLLGDAAHAIVPFHGQGMNCAFEDCVELAGMLDRSRDWPAVFERFEQERKPNTDAIAAMALENYVEMRASVLDPEYQKRKKAAEAREKSNASDIPRYSMVMFHPEISYSEAYRRGAGGH